MSAYLIERKGADLRWSRPTSLERVGDGFAMVFRQKIGVRREEPKGEVKRHKKKGKRLKERITTPRDAFSLDLCPWTFILNKLSKKVI
jgi:hypothetical protein